MANPLLESLSAQRTSEAAQGVSETEEYLQKVIRVA